MRALRHWKLITVLLLVFVAGTVTGAVVMHWTVRRAFERGLRFETWKKHAVDDIDRKLKLTTEQRQKVEAVFEDGGSELGGVLSKTLQDCGHIVVRMQRRIDEELTPEQRALHTEMKRKFRAELKRSLNYDLPEE